ncbi:MAG TPA: beta-propeller fold lactonase family protein, partial [Polyangia bacterium]|nr:beta-propeller fold lactonase family protein [Polyangia bacterium]
VYAAGPGGEIAVFKLDRISGKLAQQGSVPAGRSGALVTDRQGKFLYVASDGEVAAFAIRPKNGSLQSLGRAPAKGAGTNDLAIHRNGKYLLASNERSGNVVVFNVRIDGGLGPAEAYTAGASPQAVALNPALDFAFVLNPATITQFVFNTGTGILTPSRERPVTLPAKSNPRHLAFHPSGKFAYLIHEGTGNIAGYAFEPTSGTLSSLAFQTISLLPSGKTGKLRGGDLQPDPTGRLLFAIDRSLDTVGVFKVDAETGGLTLLKHEEAGGKPRAVAVTEGKLNPILLVAHERNLVSFNVDASTGALTQADTAPLHSAPAALAVASVR